MCLNEENISGYDSIQYGPANDNNKNNPATYVIDAPIKVASEEQRINYYSLFFKLFNI